MKLTLTNNPKYGNLWPRIVAAGIDSLLLGLWWPFVVLQLAQSQSAASLVSQAIFYSAVLIFPIAIFKFFYAVYPIHLYGQTFGKWATGLKVTDEKGNLLSRNMSVMRELVMKPVSYVLVVGFLAILFDPNHRAWHDQLAGTYVQKKGNRVLLASALFALLLIIHVAADVRAFTLVMQNTKLQNEVTQLVISIAQKIGDTTRSSF